MNKNLEKIKYLPMCRFLYDKMYAFHYREYVPGGMCHCTYHERRIY
jgi:hypothetical protein